MTAPTFKKGDMARIRLDKRRAEGQGARSRPVIIKGGVECLSCLTCCGIKPKSEFYEQSKERGGYQASCKDCQLAREKKRRESK